jgi:hypothetical protein
MSKLDTLHAEEERLRQVHKDFVSRKEDARDHIEIIQEGMNAIWALTARLGRSTVSITSKLGRKSW